jgi:hypothetical protein
MSKNKNDDQEKNEDTKGELPYPYLNIEYSLPSSFSGIVAPCMDSEITIVQRDLYEGDQQQETFRVTNLGNFPAWTCYVEAFNTDFGCGKHLSSLERVGRRILTLQPGESREILFPWATRYPGGGAIVAICHDPILDPLVTPFRSIIIGPYAERQLVYTQFTGGNR